MLSFGKSLNNFVNKLGRFAQLEACDWNCGYHSITQLERLTTNSLIQDLNRFTHQSPLNLKLQLMIAVFYFLTNNRITSKEDFASIFFGISRMYETTSRRLRRLTSLLICRLGKNFDNAFMLRALASRDLSSEDDWIQACAMRMLFCVTNGIDQIDNETKIALQSNKSYLVEATINYLHDRSFSESIPQLVIKKYYAVIHKLLKDSVNSNELVALAIAELLFRLNANDLTQLLQLVQVLESTFTTIKIIRLSIISHIVTQFKLEISHLTFVCNIVRESFYMYEASILFEAAKVIRNLVKLDRNLLDEAGNILILVKQAISKIIYILQGEDHIGKVAAINMLYDFSFTNPEAVVLTMPILESYISFSDINVSTRALLTAFNCNPTCNKKQILSNLKTKINSVPEALQINLIDNLCNANVLDSDVLNFFIKMINTSTFPNVRVSLARQLKKLCKHNWETNKEIVLDCIDALVDIIEDCNNTEVLITLIVLICDYVSYSPQINKIVLTIMNRVILQNKKIRDVSINALQHLVKRSPHLASSIHNFIDLYLDDEPETCVSFVLTDDEELEPKLKKKDISIKSFVVQKEINLHAKNIDNTNYNFKNFVSDIQKELNSSVATDFNCTLEAYAFIEHNNLSSNNELSIIDVLQKQFMTSLKSRELHQFQIDESTKIITTQPYLLTESEDDVVVQPVLHHIWNNKYFVLLELNITNNLDYITLQNVQVRINKDDRDRMHPEKVTNIKNLAPYEKASIYVAYKATNLDDLLLDSESNTSNVLRALITYDCLESGSSVTYPQQSEIKSYPILQTALFTFYRLIDDLTMPFDPLMFKIRARANISSVTQLVKELNTLPLFNGNNIYESNMNCEIYSIPFKQTLQLVFQTVVSTKGVLLKLLIASENKKLGNYIGNEIKALLV